ncbi:MAG: hypothetical protein J6P21_04355 [Clostridia bacterium]|nr:hypothetical protein [Clostridia bacterium]
MRNRNKALLLILCGIFQNTPVVESMESGKNSGNSLFKKNLIGNKRKFPGDKKSDNFEGNYNESEKNSDSESEKEPDDLSENDEIDENHGGSRFTFISPISRDNYLRYAYFLDKKFNNNGGNILKNKFFVTSSKLIKTVLKFNEIYGYESEDSEDEFIGDKNNINKFKNLKKKLECKIKHCSKQSKKIKEEDVKGLCEDIIGGVFTNSRARNHGIKFVGETLDKNKKYKFRQLLFHKLFNTFKESLNSNGKGVEFVNIYIDDFGDNNIEGLDKTYKDGTKKSQSYLKFALGTSSDTDLIDVRGKAAVLEKTECKRTIQNNNKKYNNYDYNQFRFCVESTMLNDYKTDSYINDAEICDGESIKSMFKLMDIIFNKELDSSYLDQNIFKAKFQKKDTLNIKISLKDFVEDKEFLEKCQSLTPKCKRLVCHILARLASQSVVLMDGGKLGAGIINRELNKIKLGRPERQNPIGKLLKKLDEMKVPENKDINDDIKKSD